MASPLVVGSIQNGQVELVADADRQTYTASAAVTGGTLVEHTAGDRRCQPAGAGSLLVAGVALHDAALNQTVTVAGEGVWNVVAAGAITAGQRLIAAAGGQVAAAGAAPDARTLVGMAQNDTANAALCPVRLGGSLG